MYFYHLYCRGIEKKDVFIDDTDYDRFIQSLYVFNNIETTRFAYSINTKRKQLIDLYEFCLMPNHFHLLVKTEDNELLGKYMQKLMTAYTMYFKKKYKKDGRVFESKYKKKIIKDDKYLKHIISYIHNNPLGIKYKDYKSSDLLLGFFKLDKEKIEWLDHYKYSSRNYVEVQPPLTARLDLD